ncbi:MAG: LacI family DNA-binding transcriptional regulator [Clostridia bacterium]|nr:LacI family DNA-binding transcriptional regulator [Clostridia bacterium]
MSKRTTISDIAKVLGVSNTTVTKALNGKAQVSDEMRSTVIKTAQKMGYRTNRSAQALVRKETVLYFIYSREPYEFNEYYGQGFEAALDELADFKVSGFLRPIKDMNAANEMRNILIELDSTKVDGIIMAPTVHSFEYIDELRRLADKGIPIVYLCGKLAEVAEKGCVRLNSLVAGRTAAEFLSLTMREGRSSVIFANNKELTVHKECISGYMAEAQARHLVVKGIYETQDDKEVAYYLARKVINEIPDLGGIYVSSYNSVGVCNCIEDMNKKDDIIVIGQDIYPELVKKLNSGSLRATLFQDQFNQARTAALKIFDYITGTIDSIGDILVTPHIVLKSNLECYDSGYLRTERS